MPEYPDVTVYIEAIERHALGHILESVKLNTPFLLRTYQPPIDSLCRQTLTGVRRMGKRIAFGFSNGHWMALHLMIAGRLHWNSRRQALAVFSFDNGALSLTEAGTRRQAALHLFTSEAELAAIDAGGLEVMTATLEAFTARLTASNHTLKRALTDPRILSGIGNAYSDEILHHARLSPVTLTQKLSADEIHRLLASIRDRLNYFTQSLRDQTGAGFPEKVTAFRPEMAVHGKYKEPCPNCATPIQRIVHASNETNYCPTCQTCGKLLADRALSRLLGKDWPKSLEEMELRKRL
ncbi:MAG TPA: DNA-formamidopyrimidine glycosylase family protein [Bryobacteraceae bacterium]|nr:DNA-formamidopyrimidine glycosylase family protein [Bryobacteraceae bacterium]